ncbi:histidine kinase [Paenibacillus sp. J2TS4]|uniref:sensor histidine kinase n=1 Tax=Paenibacillus sp. J2TS4 TaxID=2807194 RepID=UPI001B0142BE|nr:histidine kinase [Paenibacillus sp. J2TS4]GIP32448.1 hypothetical protein J2TS4_16580 [Paenibacillus sp. J2TS4]
MIRIVRSIYLSYKRYIQVRLTCYFLLILLPLVAISLFANVKSQHILLEQAAERTTVALQSSMDSLESHLQSVEQISTLAAADYNLIRPLDRAGAELKPRDIFDLSIYTRSLANFISINPMVSDISVYHSLSRTIVSTTRGFGQVKDEQQAEGLEAMSRTVGTGVLYKLPEERVAGTTFGTIFAADSISLIRAVDLYNLARQPNMLIITLQQVRLLHLLQTLLPSEHADIYLYTGDRRLIAGTGTERVPVLSETGAVVDGVGSEAFVVKAHSDRYDWSLVMVQPIDEVYGLTRDIRTFTLIIIIISILLALAIAWFVYISITSPLQRLSRGMKLFGSGKWNIQLPEKQMDEFGQMTREFNQMAVRHKELIQGYYEQQLRLAQTDLKFLQSQINPHFLYNTLDSIYWIAKNYEAVEISEMVHHLSKFFRLSLSKGRETFTLEETITHLHYYIRVQQLRFMEKFSVEYVIAEETNPLPILKLILQPLVENAILHGMEKRKKGGRLIIESAIEDGQLVLVVEDNGPGIDEKRLCYIQEELNGQMERVGRQPAYLSNDKSDLFGLRNVASRIRLYYGERASLTIASRQGICTKVTLKLPLELCVHDIEPYPPQSEEREEA